MGQREWSRSSAHGELGRPNRAIDQLDPERALQVGDGLRNGRLRRSEAPGRGRHAAGVDDRDEDIERSQIDNRLLHHKAKLPKRRPTVPDGRDAAVLGLED